MNAGRRPGQGTGSRREIGSRPRWTSAQVQLAYCHITAPISGRVGLRLVDAGNIVHASDTNPLLVITELQPIAVIFNVAEDDLPQIQKQLRAGQTIGRGCV